MVALNKKIKNILWHVVSSGLPVDYDLDVLRKFLLLNSVIIIGSIFLAILSIIAFIQEDLILSVADCSILLFLLCLLYILRKYKCYNLVGIFGATVTGFFYLFLIAHGGIERTAYLWILTYPLIVLYLLGKKYGTYFSILFLGMTCVFLYLGRVIESFQYYSLTIIIRLVSVYEHITR